MKYRTRSLPVLSALLILSLQPLQAVSKIVEPEYIGVFAALDPSTGALIELERRTNTERIKIKGLGFGGGEAYLQIPGERSPVRFKGDAVPAFVVRVASQQSDPQSSIRLVSWRVDKRARHISIGKAGAFGVGATSGAEESLLPFNATRYGEISFKIVPAQSLPPGEYAFGMADGRESFSFGIDPPGGEKPPSLASPASAVSDQRDVRPDTKAEAREPTSEKPLTNDDVLAMVKAGLGDELTISKIKDAPSVDLDVSADALIRMKKEGASKAVIDAMMKRARPKAK